ncbi:MAG: thiol:disulfide interchange protein DsbA/DsbL [Magnetococcales bacterium]|nr:thiol:disulfide interchange protein DsbA/DsbL [Magnetococcales bacterium]
MRHRLVFVRGAWWVGMCLSLLTWLVSAPVGADPFVPKVGEHFEAIIPPVPVSGSKPEVVEVFNFKCPHCIKLHPAMNDWTEKMKGRYDIKSLPIAFSQQTDQPLRAFYAAQFMGREADMKHALFNAHFVDQINLDSPQELAFIAEGMKIDSAAFQAHMNSFGVQGKIAQGRALAQSYGITGTPTLVINGRYRVTPGKHDQGNYERLFEIVEALAAQ